MKTYEFVGKNVQKAIETGLKELGLSEVDVDIKILDEGGFFRKAKVQLSTEKEVEIEIKEQTTTDKKPEKETKKENTGKKAEKETKEKETDKKINKEEKVATVEVKPEKEDSFDEEEVIAKINEFLKELLSKMKIEGNISVTNKEDSVLFGVNGEKVNELIGKRGETLNAIQEILAIVGRNAGLRDKKIYFDVENYKERRQETLKNLAKRLAEKAVKYCKPVKLEPMTAYERKIIHTTLQEDDRVTTKSEGEEPNRHLVIIPKK